LTLASHRSALSTTGFALSLTSITEASQIR
jgi:hypothetical protein